MLGAVVFLPLYLQISRGVTPTISGLMLTPMTAGIILATIIAGNYMRKTGRYRVLPLIGMALLIPAGAWLTQIAVDTSTWVFSGMIMFFGFGVGLSFPVLTTAVQNAVPRKLLGTATASGVMFRQIGGSLAVAVFGAILTARLSAQSGGMSFSSEMGPTALAHLDPTIRTMIATHIVNAIAPIYWLVSVVAVLGVTAAWAMREIPLANRHIPPQGE